MIMKISTRNVAQMMTWLKIIFSLLFEMPNPKKKNPNISKIWCVLKFPMVITASKLGINAM